MLLKIQNKKNSYKTIDFEALLARNSDVKGWIDIPDTKVSYPIVQGETNDTYIHSDIDKRNLEPVQFLLQVKIKTLLLI